MKKFLLVISLIVTSAHSYGNWVSMQNTGSEMIDYTWNRCYYTATFSNFNISINHKGFCPMFIKYNPSTNEWKK